jgi:hypothetical protein
VFLAGSQHGCTAERDKTWFQKTSPFSDAFVGGLLSPVTGTHAFTRFTCTSFFACWLHCLIHAMDIDVSRRLGWSMQLCYDRYPTSPFQRALQPHLARPCHSDFLLLIVLLFPGLPASYLVQPTPIVSWPAWVDRPVVSMFTDKQLHCGMLKNCDSCGTGEC